MKHHVVDKNIQLSSHRVRRHDLFTIVVCVRAHDGPRLADGWLCIFFSFSLSWNRKWIQVLLCMICAFRSIVFWFLFHPDFFYRSFDLFQFYSSIEIYHIFCFFILATILLIFHLILIPLIYMFVLLIHLILFQFGFNFLNPSEAVPIFYLYLCVYTFSFSF